MPSYIDRLAFTDVFDSQALYQFNGVRVGQGTSGEGVAALSIVGHA